MTTTTSPPPPPSPPGMPCRFEIRVAIALNNMAITMMERCCYHQAFETLADAVSALRIPMRLSASTCNKRAPTFRVPGSPLQSLQQANERLLRPVNDDSRSSSSLPPLHVTLQHDISASLLDASSSTSKTGLLSTSRRRALLMSKKQMTSSRNNHVSTMIRLDDDDSDDTTTEPPMETKEILMTMILYNFGIANQLLAHTTSTGRRSSDAAAAAASRKRHQLASAQVMKVAKNLLSHQLNSFFDVCKHKSGACCNNKTGNSSNKDPFHLAQLLFVSTLVVETQITTALLSSSSPSCCPAATTTKSEETCNKQVVKTGVAALARIHRTIQRLKEDPRWVQVATMITCHPAAAA